MIDNYRGWHEMLPYALLGYRTTVRTSVGATPYLLVYGTEAVIPAEIEIPSLRIIQEAELSDTEWVRKRINQLTLIDEKRMVAVCYRTTVRTSVGATPYLLVYGTEAVIPAKVEIPSLRIIQEAELSDVEWVRKWIDQLTMIDEKRMVVVCHGQLYRHRMIRALHNKVRARMFEIGQLVLKHIFPHQDEYKGKFAPNWQGPYMVHKV
ncbi:uncharacterized protein [Solanum tuberosum]|uniref:uncharacterized protein n=1 Tax=Solanum tuberosum TaxID=4113 RepID=UPI00073A3C26|nr:PREDICTED: uncharacterized protein LOC107059524 [Solanum tuberosum]